MTLKTVRVVMLCAILSSMTSWGKIEPIKLESRLLELVDGNFLNADVLERIHLFVHNVLGMLLGEKTADGLRIGHYTFDNKKMTAREIALIEETFDTLQTTNPTHAADLKKQRDIILRQMKNEFLDTSVHLKGLSYGFKPIICSLIEESSSRRGRKDTLLTTWAQIEEHQEDRVFNEQVKTVAIFCTFCTDLLHFVADFEHSCPKARKQYEDRIAKWQVFKKIIDKNFHQSSLPEGFLVYFKQQHLDRLKLDEVTVEYVRRTLEEFKKGSTTITYRTKELGLYEL